MSSFSCGNALTRCVRPCKIGALSTERCRTLPPSAICEFFYAKSDPHMCSYKSRNRQRASTIAAHMVQIKEQQAVSRIIQNRFCPSLNNFFVELKKSLLQLITAFLLLYLFDNRESIFRRDLIFNKIYIII